MRMGGPAHMPKLQARAHLLPDRQIPASRHISRGEPRLQEIASSSADEP
jgi:hypothetical protein